jgi:transposase-like protein
MSIKYTPAKAESFCDHYATGLYSIAELCRLVDITTGTFYYWKENYDDFKKLLEAADKRKITSIHTLAIRGLVKLIGGLEYDEISEEYEVPATKPKYDFLDDDDELNQIIKPEEPKPVLVKRYVTKKVILPNVNAVMFALRNLDKENFPENKELTFDNKQPIPVAFIPPPGMVVSFPSNTDDDTNSNTGNTPPGPDSGAGTSA